MARINQVVTVGASPVQLATTKTVVHRIFIQMKSGASAGIGYVMCGIPPGTTPDPTTAGHLTAELSPATATAPGGSFADEGPGIDLNRIWLHGGHAGDKILVSYELEYKL